MAELSVGVIPGDGIGLEVVPEALPVLSRAAAADGLELSFERFDWGASRYLSQGAMMPEDGADALRPLDAVLFGAVGHPEVPDHVTSWGLILPLRQQLGLFANIRPVRAWPGVESPVRGAEGAEIVVVRENAEGEYAGIGGRLASQPGEDVAVEVALHTRAGIERIARTAFELAARRGARLTVATKSNSIKHGYVLWDEIVAEVAAGHPEVEYELALVDALAARVIRDPHSVEVILASNLFGDILSDLVSVIAGSLGMAPSANLGLAGESTPIYEPVHGSAPDIAGRGVANPCAFLLSGAMMLEDHGAAAAAAGIRSAVASALASPGRITPDLGGGGTTASFVEAIDAGLREAV